MSKQHGTKDFWLAGLRTEGEAFRTAVHGEGALTAEVPSCPEWTVAQLVRHLGSLYTWVAANVQRGVTTHPDGEPQQVAYDGTELLSWWDACFAELVGVLDSVDPDAPAWNRAPRPKTAHYWHRRMANETAIHRWDAQLASTLPEPIEGRLAADGVTEVIDTLLPAGLRRGPRERTGVVALNASDVDQVWYVRLRGSGVALLDTDTLLDDDDHHERATAIGSASDLLLALYGRVPFDVLQVSGDVALLDSLRTG